MNLLVNFPRLLQVKVSVANLCAAVTKRATADLLARLAEGGNSDPDLAAKAEESLRANGLVLDQNTDRGLTPLGSSLLCDDNDHFENSLGSTYQYSGYDAARRRIALFASAQLDEMRLAERARVVRDLQEQLDREGDSLESRQQLVAEWMRWLISLREALTQARIEHEQEVAALERDRDNLRQRRQAQPEVAARPRGLKNQAKHLIGRLPRLSKTAPAEDHSAELLRGVEEDLLRAHVHAVVLEAEELTVNDVMRELTAEEARGNQAMALLTDEIQVLRAAAQQASMSRGWSVASGEICLNGDSLTEAVVAKLDAEGMWAQFSELYRERHERDIFAETNGIFGKQDLAEIEDIIREIINARLDWNAVDCIAALIEGETGTGNTLREAVRQIAGRDFLATGYNGYLRHNTFAAISYAPGRTPKADKVFQHLLEDLRREIDAGVNEYIDHHDRECVTIYVEDRAIPAFAMSVYDDSLYEAYDVRNNPAFTPHPEIYGVSTSKHAAEQIIRRMAEMLHLVVGGSVRQVERAGAQGGAPTASGEERTSDEEVIPLDGRLGAYLPDERLIEIYTANIREAARLLGLGREVVRRVVEAHEAAHAIIHLGQDADGCAFETEAFKSADGGATPSPLQETLAQLLCWHFLKGDAELRACFETLSEHQPAAYGHWQKLRGLNLEQLRDILIHLRRGEIEANVDTLTAIG